MNCGKTWLGRTTGQFGKSWLVGDQGIPSYLAFSGNGEEPGIFCTNIPYHAGAVKTVPSVVLSGRGGTVDHRRFM